MRRWDSQGPPGVSSGQPGIEQGRRILRTLPCGLAIMPTWESTGIRPAAIWANCTSEWRLGFFGSGISLSRDRCSIRCAIACESMPHLLIRQSGGAFRRVRFALACRTEPLIQIYSRNNSLYRCFRVHGSFFLSALRSRVDSSPEPTRWHGAGLAQILPPSGRAAQTAGAKLKANPGTSVRKYYFRLLLCQIIDARVASPAPLWATWPTSREWTPAIRLREECFSASPHPPPR